MATLKVVILGSTNVGKSTLFNALCRRKRALEAAEPNLTRDNNSAIITANGQKIEIIDTAGLNTEARNGLLAVANLKSLEAASQADYALLVLDGSRELNNDDQEAVRLVRKAGIPFSVLINKLDAKQKLDSNAIYQISKDAPICISAAHRSGLFALYKLFEERFAKILPEENSGLQVEQDLIEEGRDSICRLALIGRPNVGKSTLFNRFLNYEHNLVSSIAGTTRDSIEKELVATEGIIKLIDTAGLRKKSRVLRNTAESLSIKQTIDAIRNSSVVGLVMDATQLLDKQDLKLLDIILGQNKGIHIIINKCDLVEDANLLKKVISDYFKVNISRVIDVSISCTSALWKYDIDSIIKNVLLVEKHRNAQISTGQLNSWLQKAMQKHSPSTVAGKKLKSKYITQISTSPPAFKLFVNSAKLHTGKNIKHKDLCYLPLSRL